VERVATAWLRGRRAVRVACGNAEGNAAIYRAALDRANAGDLAGYVDLYSDDVVFGGVTPEPMDKAGVVAFHENFYSAFPGTQVEVLDLIETGDQLAARLVLSGPHEGPFWARRLPATTSSSPSPRSSRCATANASSAGRRPTCSAC
jgi:predicted ester cyclase